MVDFPPCAARRLLMGSNCSAALPAVGDGRPGDVVSAGAFWRTAMALCSSNDGVGGVDMVSVEGESGGCEWGEVMKKRRSLRSGWGEGINLESEKAYGPFFRYLNRGPSVLFICPWPFHEIMLVWFYV